MARETIDISYAANTRLGDPTRVAHAKINRMTAELYSIVGSAFDTSTMRTYATKASANAAAAAIADGVLVQVLVDESLTYTRTVYEVSGGSLDYVTTLDGQPALNLMRWGPDATGTSASETEWNSALVALKSSGTSRLYVPRGTYKVADSIAPGVMGCDVEIICEPGAKVVAASGMDVGVLRIFAHASATSGYRLRLVNWRADCSSGAVVAADNSCSGLSLYYWGDVQIDNPHLYGGLNPNNTNADSGIETVACGYVQVRGGKIEGFSDAGVYPNGDGTTAAINDGVSVDLDGVWIRRCNAAVAPKRELRHFRMRNCVVEECNAGVVAAEVPGPPYLMGPRRMTITDNVFRKVTASVGRFRGQIRGEFSRNIVEDWGMAGYDSGTDTFGTSSAGTNGIALRIYGGRDTAGSESTGLRVVGNHFRLKEWSRNSTIAVQQENITLDGTLYTFGGNSYANNRYSDCNIALYDGAGGNLSTYDQEIFENVATKFGGSFSASNVVAYRDMSNGVPMLRSNGFDLASSWRRKTVTTATTLTSADTATTFNNSGATALTTITLPAAALGLEYAFSITDTDGIRVQTSGTNVISSSTLGSTSAGGYYQSTTAYSYLRIYAISSSAWCAEVYTGTWTKV